MLNETSVSCLVVAGMEAVLEDGHLDVVSFFCVLPRELTLSPDLTPLNGRVVKIAVGVLANDLYLPTPALGLCGIDNLSCLQMCGGSHH